MQTSPPMLSINVDAVAFQDASGDWIAQCIQYDISVHAKSLPELKKALEREIAANVCINEKLGRKGLEGIPSAPKKYEEVFNSAGLELSPSYRLKTLDSSKSVHLHNLKVVEAA